MSVGVLHKYFYTVLTAQVILSLINSLFTLSDNGAIIAVFGFFGAYRNSKYGLLAVCVQYSFKVWITYSTGPTWWLTLKISKSTSCLLQFQLYWTSSEFFCGPTILWAKCYLIIVHWGTQKILKGQKFCPSLQVSLTDFIIIAIQKLLYHDALFWNGYESYWKCVCFFHSQIAQFEDKYSHTFVWRLFGFSFEFTF